MCAGNEKKNQQALEGPKRLWLDALSYGTVWKATQDFSWASCAHFLAATNILGGNVWCLWYLWLAHAALGPLRPDAYAWINHAHLLAYLFNKRSYLRLERQLCAALVLGAMFGDFGGQNEYFWFISQCILIGWSITCILCKFTCDWPNVSEHKSQSVEIASKLHLEVIRKVNLFLNNVY